jgi:hypothetical protein
LRLIDRGISGGIDHDLGLAALENARYRGPVGNVVSTAVDRLRSQADRAWRRSPSADGQRSRSYRSP